MLMGMRFGRIATPEGMTFAVIDDDATTAKQIKATPFTEPEYTGKEWKLDDVRLLAPMLPSKVVAIGRNYADHVAEVSSSRPSTCLRRCSSSRRQRSSAPKRRSRSRTLPPASSSKASWLS